MSYRQHVCTIEADSPPDMRKIPIHNIHDRQSSLDVTLSSTRSKEEKKDEEKYFHNYTHYRNIRYVCKVEK